MKEFRDLSQGVLWRFPVVYGHSTQLPFVCMVDFVFERCVGILSCVWFFCRPLVSGEGSDLKWVESVDQTFFYLEDCDEFWLDWWRRDLFSNITKWEGPLLLFFFRMLSFSLVDIPSTISLLDVFMFPYHFLNGPNFESKSLKDQRPLRLGQLVRKTLRPNRKGLFVPGLPERYWN